MDVLDVVMNIKETLGGGGRSARVRVKFHLTYPYAPLPRPLGLISHDLYMTLSNVISCICMYTYMHK